MDFETCSSCRLRFSGLALLVFVLLGTWHTVSPPGAAVIIFVAGLLLFLGLRPMK
jgi:hypothetical protein